MLDQFGVKPRRNGSLRSMGKLARVGAEEFSRLDLQLWLVNVMARGLPSGLGGRLRSSLYRALGMAVGSRTIIRGALTIGAAPGAIRRIRIGEGCFINSHVYVDASGPVTLGDQVTIGHHVTIITADHAIGPPERRAGGVVASGVTIEDGVWIAAQVTVLPGITIGRGAIVAAGAVVVQDVPPNSLAGGVPARVIRTLESR